MPPPAMSTNADDLIAVSFRNRRTCPRTRDAGLIRTRSVGPAVDSSHASLLPGLPHIK
jgi:hypothetical protein